jgi:ATP/maltotriose-dependent transcriptional regulator MalT
MTGSSEASKVALDGHVDRAVIQIGQAVGIPNLTFLSARSALHAPTFWQTTPGFRQKCESAVVQHELLSARETEILRRVSRGCSNQEIADQLSITVGTTKGHLHRIFGKLDVRNRTAAVAKARKLSLL